jgi:tetratricopeptide (TPR) repeat protein
MSSRGDKIHTTVARDDWTAPGIWPSTIISALIRYYVVNAEAYMDNGDTRLAIASYQKSLQLDPSNSNAVENAEKTQLCQLSAANLSRSHLLPLYSSAHIFSPTHRLARGLLSCL